MDHADELYETDFYAWTRAQTRELRRLKEGRNDVALDLQHLIAEVFSLGLSERDTCRSEIERILEHFLKLGYSPAEAPRAGWKRSIVGARAVLRRKLSKALSRDAERQFLKLYEVGRKAALFGLQEYGEWQAAKRLPQTCPYSLDDILRDDWYPEPPEMRNV